MRIGETFPSTYLKAAELGKARPVVTIREVVVEDIGDETKPILYFVGKEKGLVLNKTNANMITEILGTDETTDWIGKAIQLYVTKVDYQGRRVDAIRILEPQGGAAVTEVAKPVAAAKPKPTAVAAPVVAADEDVPF